MFFLSFLSPYTFLPNFTFPRILPLITETHCCVKWIFYFRVPLAQNSPKALALEENNVPTSTISQFLPPPQNPEGDQMTLQVWEGVRRMGMETSKDKVCPICSGPWKSCFLSPLPLLHHIPKITSMIFFFNLRIHFHFKKEEHGSLIRNSICLQEKGSWVWVSRIL